MELQERVVRTIRARALFGENARLLLALSGGPDSTAMAHIVRSLAESWGLEISALHVNYHLRQEESEGDEAFVRDLCERLGIGLALRSAPPGLTREKGESLQMVARRTRYRFLEEERARLGADRILTGHNRDDRTETFLLNLFRGAGTRGLGAIPYRRGSIVRPLLDVTREEIEKYLEEARLPYRSDRSNRETLYERNKIRLELIPFAEKLLGRSFRGSIARTADLLAETELFLDRQAAHWLEDHGERERSGAWILPAAQVEQMPLALARQVIRLAVRDLWGETAAIRFDLVEQAVGMAGRGRAGSVPLPGGGEVSREGPLLRIGPAVGPGSSYAVAVPLEGETLLPEGRRIRTSVRGIGEAPPDPRSLPAEVALFDTHRIEPPLLARTRLPGDRLQPLGAPGEKKLQDLLVDRKVPRSLRDRIPILVDGEGILWVCGLVIAERAKITSQTMRVLEVAIYPARDDTISWD